MSMDDSNAVNKRHWRMKRERIRGIVELQNKHKTTEGALLMTKHNTKEFGGQRLDESFSLKHTTPYGGANLLWDYAESAVGLSRLFVNSLGFSKAANAKYPLHQALTVLVLASAIGLDRIFHLAGIEDDPLFLRKSGWTKLPDYTTFYNDLNRFDEAAKIEPLRVVLTAVAKRTQRKKCILDFDSTAETVYGNQEGAAVGYNPNKHGRKSYHPLMVFDGPSQALVNAMLRPGNAASSDSFVGLLHGTLALFGRERVDSLRMDAGFAGDDVYAEAEEHTVLGYVAKSKIYKDLAEHARCFPWRRVECTDVIIEVKSFAHQAKKWRKTRRVVMVRYRPAETVTTGQGKLFDDLDWQTAAMVTNFDWAEEDVWHFYNQRCSQENYIKEMKDGFGMDKIPGGDFYPNYAMMLLKGISYNLVLGLKKEIAAGRFERLTVVRLRRELFWVVGKIVSHAGRLALKLSANYRAQADYLCMRRMLDALAT